MAGDHFDVVIFPYTCSETNRMLFRKGHATQDLIGNMLLLMSDVWFLIITMKCLCNACLQSTSFFLVIKWFGQCHFNQCVIQVCNTYGKGYVFLCHSVHNNLAYDGTTTKMYISQQYQLLCTDRLSAQSVWVKPFPHASICCFRKLECQTNGSGKLGISHVSTSNVSFDQVMSRFCILKNRGIYPNDLFHQYTVYSDMNIHQNDL